MTHKHTIIRIGPWSQRLSPRALLVAPALLLLLLIAMGLSLRIGTYPLSLHELQAALSGRADALIQLIVVENRMPRILTGVGAGAALGLSGAMFQSLMRNPLAAPDVMGFGAGASFGALLSVALFGGGIFILPGAVLGGLAAAALVFLLAWNKGAAPFRVVLVGIAVSLTLSSLADLLMSRLDILTAGELAKWLAGTLNTRNWDDVQIIWLGLAVMGPLAFWQGFNLTRMETSDDIAIGQGIDVNRVRLWAGFVSVVLISLAVSVAGPLPFVAFVAGPIARQLGGSGSVQLVGAALVGAIVTLLADFIARYAFGGLSLPTGVFTAAIGAPFLLWLLSREFKNE